MKNLSLPIVVSLLLLTAGCGDATGPNAGQGRVDLSFAATRSGAQSAAAETMTLGGNTLVIDRVQLVLREVALKRARGTGDCSSSSDSDDCEELEIGPFLLDLPLGGGIARPVSIVVDTGTFRELEFEVHKPEDDGRDREFLALHPDFARVSIRVAGTFNGTPFVFLSDLDVEQEIDLVPSLVVGEAASTNLTLSVDLGRWFLNALRTTLVNPGSANKGGANEGLVKDNIKQSFEAFEDNDRDGRHD